MVGSETSWEQDDERRHEQGRKCNLYGCFAGLNYHYWGARGGTIQLGETERGQHSSRPAWLATCTQWVLLVVPAFTSVFRGRFLLAEPTSLSCHLPALKRLQLRADVSCGSVSEKRAYVARARAYILFNGHSA